MAATREKKLVSKRKWMRGIITRQTATAGHPSQGEVFSREKAISSASHLHTVFQRLPLRTLGKRA